MELLLIKEWVGLAGDGALVAMVVLNWKLLRFVFSLHTRITVIETKVGAKKHGH